MISAALLPRRFGQGRAASIDDFADFIDALLQRLRHVAPTFGQDTGHLARAHHQRLVEAVDRAPRADPPAHDLVEAGRDLLAAPRRTIFELAQATFYDVGGLAGLVAKRIRQRLPSMLITRSIRVEATRNHAAHGLDIAREPVDQSTAILQKSVLDQRQLLAYDAGEFLSALGKALLEAAGALADGGVQVLGAAVDRLAQIAGACLDGFAEAAGACFERFIEIAGACLDGFVEAAGACLQCLLELVAALDDDRFETVEAVAQQLVET